MSERGDRLAPQYGEYATPDEQRAAIKAPVSHDEGVPVEREDGVPVEREDAAGRPPQAAHVGAPAAPVTGSRRADRLVSLALLAFGLLNVLSVVPGFLNLGTIVNSTFVQYGLGTYTPTALTATIGVVLVVVYIGGWLVTAALTLLSLRRGRVSFWIPLVAGIAASVIAMACFVVLFVNDPAFMEYAANR